MKHVLFPLMLVGLLAVSCGQSVPEHALTTRAVSVALKDSTEDGKAILRGIAFGEQEVGELLPEIWDGVSIHDLAENDKELQNIQAGVDTYMTEIEAADPSLFAEISTSMRSGDPTQVEAALHRVGDLTEKMYQDTAASDPAPQYEGAKGFFITRNKFIVTNKALVKDRYVGLNTVLVKNQVAVLDTAVVKNVLIWRDSVVVRQTVAVRTTILARLKIFVFKAGQVESLFSNDKITSLQQDELLAQLTSRLAN
jgi:SdpC family antimicrobial peptide